MSQNTGTTLVRRPAAVGPFIAIAVMTVVVVAGFVAAVGIGVDAFTSPGSGATTTNALGLADDFALRHAERLAELSRINDAAAAAPTLTQADDYATRHAVSAPILGTDDDYGTRHAVSAPILGTDDDYATRHAPSAPALGTDDDYALRHR